MSNLNEILNEIVSKREQVTELKDNDIFEISLVPESATRNGEFVVKKSRDSNTEGEQVMSSIDKAKNTKVELEKEIENKAEDYSNKRGCDLSLARLKVLENNPELYQQYKNVYHKLESSTNAELLSN